MTTSVLSPLSAELRDQDLQTIKDFAREAPWEWQKALLALVEFKELAGDLDSEDLTGLQERIEELETEVEEHADEKESLRRLKEESLVRVVKMRELINEITTVVMNVVVNTGAAEKVKKILDSFTDDFTAEVDELEATAKGEMTAIEEEEVKAKVVKLVAKASKGKKK